MLTMTIQIPEITVEELAFRVVDKLLNIPREAKAFINFKTVQLI